MVRIIGGQARGRRLAVADGPTRPTSDRAREGLFSTLESMIGTLTGKRVLDLYAGSGGLGLEALSRGALSVMMIEHDRKAAIICKENIATVAMPGATVQRMSVETYLSQTQDSYDVVLADPPYSESNESIERMLKLVGSVIVGEGVIVVERATRDPAFTWPTAFSPDRERKYGEATLYYGRRTR